MIEHIPVMLKESLEILNINPDGIYLDLTLGGGTHSLNILKKLQTGLLIAFDKDKSLIKKAFSKFSKIKPNFKLIHADFKNCILELKKLNIEKVDGIIADLGISSIQLDDIKRGFSFSKNSFLDMRMNQEQEFTAYNLLNNYSQENLIYILKKYGNVKFASRIVKNIILQRPINTTFELVEIIKKSLPAVIIRKKNPFRNIFQALRIEVNQEIEALKSLLKFGPFLLKKNGVLLIITFHSLEDRLVKKEFQKYILDNTGKIPIKIFKKWIAKSIKISKNEILLNNRSRSAKLRFLKKII